jgi:hypothetical protein
MIKISDYCAILVCDKLPSVLCRIMYKVMLDVESSLHSEFSKRTIYCAHDLSWSRNICLRSVFHVNVH